MSLFAYSLLNHRIRNHNRIRTNPCFTSHPGLAVQTALICSVWIAHHTPPLDCAKNISFQPGISPTLKLYLELSQESGSLLLLYQSRGILHHHQTPSPLFPIWEYSGANESGQSNGILLPGYTQKGRRLWRSKWLEYKLFLLWAERSIWPPGGMDAPR